MTEKMRALRALYERGECTVSHVVDATDIGYGRIFATLQALVRDQQATKAQRVGQVCFSITEAGRQRVESWQRDEVLKQQEVSHV